jgi:ferredoxin-thioredoxin reductase catalytic subunit/rubredoxin
MSGQPTTNRIEELFRKLLAEAAEGGYYLNPDEEFTRELVESLIVNIDRYGYPACPCRLAAGTREDDLDIICPCDYRDPDLDQFGACYCALYVSEEIARGDREAKPIPERRPPKGDREKAGGRREEEVSASRTHAPTHSRTDVLAYPVWRCKVCGYLCAREHPPGKCPVCKADKDRFERFI